jgi:hypothetical protein
MTINGLLSFPNRMEVTNKRVRVTMRDCPYD